MARKLETFNLEKLDPEEYIFNKSILINNEIKSLLLEEEIWVAFGLICTYEKMSITVLISLINDRKQPNITLENACRVFVLHYYIQKGLPGDEHKEIIDRYKMYIARNSSTARMN